MSETDLAVRDSGAAIVKAIPVPRDLQELGVRFGADESGTRVVYLPDELRERVNLIAPVTSYVQADPNWSPGISIVKLTKEEHTYPIPGGKHGLNKQALETLSRAAGVLYTRTARVPKDELQEGELWAYRATVGFRRSDGTVDEVTRERGFNREAEQMEIEDSVRNAVVWANGQKTDRPKYATEEAVAAEVRKRWIAELRFGPAKTESKAINRALRAGLGIPTSVQQAALAKPWLVIGYNFTPDYSDPEIKRALVAIGLNASAAIYGGREASDEMPERGEADIPGEALGELSPAPTPAETPADDAERDGSRVDEQAARGDQDEPEAQTDGVAASGSSEPEPALEEEPELEPSIRIPSKAIDAAGATIAKGEKTIAETVDAAAAGDAKALEWVAWALRNLPIEGDDQRRASIELYASNRQAELWADLTAAVDG